MVVLVHQKEQFPKAIKNFYAKYLGIFWVFSNYLPSVVIAVIIWRKKIRETHYINQKSSGATAVFIFYHQIMFAGSQIFKDGIFLKIIK